MLHFVKMLHVCTILHHRSFLLAPEELVDAVKFTQTAYFVQCCTVAQKYEGPSHSFYIYCRFCAGSACVVWLATTF